MPTDLKSCPGFCRDCLKPQSHAVRRCDRCGSPRLVRHPELHDLAIAHIDCDAFYASVEKRDNPELARQAGDHRRRPARRRLDRLLYRPHPAASAPAMPMFKALEACPEAVVIRPDMEKYVARRPRRSAR